MSNSLGLTVKEEDWQQFILAKQLYIDEPERKRKNLEEIKKLESEQQNIKKLIIVLCNDIDKLKEDFPKTTVIGKEGEREIWVATIHLSKEELDVLSRKSYIIAFEIAKTLKSVT